MTEQDLISCIPSHVKYCTQMFHRDRLHKLKALKNWNNSQKIICTIPPLYTYRSLMSERVLLELPSEMQFISRQKAVSHLPNVLTNVLAFFVAGKISAGIDPSPSYTWVVYHVKVENSYPGVLGWSEPHCGRRGSMSLYSRALIDSTAALGHIEFECRL